jgi:hypothetical protein
MNASSEHSADLLYDFTEISASLLHSEKSNLPIGFILFSDAIEICVSSVQEIIEHPGLADPRETEIVIGSGRMIKFFEIQAVCSSDVLLGMMDRSEIKDEVFNDLIIFFPD